MTKLWSALLTTTTKDCACVVCNCCKYCIFDELSVFVVAVVYYIVYYCIVILCHQVHTTGVVVSFIPQLQGC